MSLTIIASATSTSTLSVPAHNAGDYLVLIETGAFDSYSIPALRSGWTNLDSVSGAGLFGGVRSSRLSWIESDGSIASLTSPGRSSVIIVRGGESVQGNIDSSGANGTNLAVASLAGLDTAGTSLLLCSIWTPAPTAIGSPYTYVNGTYSKLENNSNSSAPAANFTHGNTPDIRWTVEVTAPPSINADAAITLGGVSLAATGKLEITAQSGITLGGVTLLATGNDDVVIVGLSSITLGAAILGATAQLEIAGAGAITLGAFGLSSTMSRTVFAITPTERRLILAAAARASRTLSFAAARRDARTLTFTE